MDAIFDRSADSGVNADVSSSRDIYEGVAVSILMSMKNDILEMTDFGEVMSRIQTVPQGIELSHVIARAKAFAVKGLLASHEEDGMKVFSSKNHYSTPPSLKKPSRSPRYSGQVEFRREGRCVQHAFFGQFERRNRRIAE